jgi:hypothetical protein
MIRFIALIGFILTFKAQAYWVPQDAFTFEFNVKTVRMPPLKAQKLYDSIEILREIFSSSEFRRRILHHRFNGERTFHRNNGLTNDQIYWLILSGRERLTPHKNNAMDVEVELYSDFNSSVLGFTMPRTKRIWMNLKYFNKNSPADIASHLTHEWLHKLGFDHEKDKTSLRKYSVPYAVGYIVKDLTRKLQRRFPGYRQLKRQGNDPNFLLKHKI